MPRKSQGRSKSEYGQQFQEKQDVKNIYGLREKQFKRYFKVGATPYSVVSLLEKRLDNVAFRAGFAGTRKFARQLVSHGHFKVNGKNVDIPSYQVKIGDEITIKPRSGSIVPFKDLSLTLKKYEPPSWISIDADKLAIKILSGPTADESFMSTSIKPIIEFYSR